jgi:hypothetical protein
MLPSYRCNTATLPTTLIFTKLNASSPQSHHNPTPFLTISLACCHNTMHASPPSHLPPQSPPPTLHPLPLPLISCTLSTPITWPRVIPNDIRPPDPPWTCIIKRTSSLCRRAETGVGVDRRGRTAAGKDDEQDVAHLLDGWPLKR